MTPLTDVIDAALGGELAETVRAVRQSRPAVVAHTQGVHDALFQGPGGLAFGPERLAAVAAHIADLAGAKALAAHYAATAAPGDAADPKLAAALTHVTRLTLAPATSARAHIAELHAAGLTELEIVTVAQLAGFVNYQIRLLAGLTLIGATHE
ncbi:hypothetical protein AB0H76_22205 [Nocardia sp. NPDC050712]|uniref:hypothetical protein n=1 Tax=Nocardia sp. NPDC050712 TaxID=3155518 RepID=UPI0033D8764E